MLNLTRVTRWECPHCNHTDVTREHLPHTRYHPCRTGLTAPMVEVGVKCKVEMVERGDNIGKELVQTDANGRPVMAVRTTRDAGVDVTVYAPTAQATRRDP